MLYPEFPISCVMVISFVAALLPYTAKVYEHSKVYLRQVKQNLGKKYDKKLARTLRPLAIGIGSFGRVDKELLPEFIRNVTGYASDLLLTF